jgi:hypothetical protein
MLILTKYFIKFFCILSAKLTFFKKLRECVLRCKIVLLKEKAFLCLLYKAAKTSRVDNSSFRQFLYPSVVELLRISE